MHQCVHELTISHWATSRLAQHQARNKNPRDLLTLLVTKQRHTRQVYYGCLPLHSCQRNPVPVAWCSISAMTLDSRASKSEQLVHFFGSYSCLAGCFFPALAVFLGSPLAGRLSFGLAIFLTSQWLFLPPSGVSSLPLRPLFRFLRPTVGHQRSERGSCSKVLISHSQFVVKILTFSFFPINTSFYVSLTLQHHHSTMN